LFASFLDVNSVCLRVQRWLLVPAAGALASRPIAKGIIKHKKQKLDKNAKQGFEPGSARRKLRDFTT